jgi:hypothetical protein
LDILRILGQIIEVLVKAEQDFYREKWQKE